MIYTRILARFVWLLAVCLGGACSSAGGLAGGTTSKKGAKPASPAPTKDESTPDESDKASQPQQVSGSFLTSMVCGPDTQGDKSAGDPFGCKFVNADGSKISGTLTAPAVTVTLKGAGTKITPNAESGAASAPWHVTFVLPTGTGAQIATVDVKGQLAGKAVHGATTSIDGQTASKSGTLGTDGTITTDSGQSSTGNTAAPSSAAAQIVFVTTMTFQPGNNGSRRFDSPELADGLCTAAAAAIPATVIAANTSFKAVLSSSSPATNAKDRVAIKGAVKNTAGQVVAADANGFWSQHTNPVLNETGTPPADGGTAWTGSGPGGVLAAGQTCHDHWDWGIVPGVADGLGGDVVNGAQGKASDLTPAWLSVGGAAECGETSINSDLQENHVAHLICVSQ